MGREHQQRLHGSLAVDGCQVEQLAVACAHAPRCKALITQSYTAAESIRYREQEDDVKSIMTQHVPCGHDLVVASSQKVAQSPLTSSTFCPAQEVVRPLQLDERMIALAAAISIDFDYFSQHSHGPGV